MIPAPSDPAIPVRPGEVLAGRYQVERVLGEGGMGIVVAALHLDLQQTVALKFLRPKALEHPEIASRFLQEARAAVRLKSHHVAKVLDVGRMDNGQPFLVMEYLTGTTLGERLRVDGPMTPTQAAYFLVQAAEAIAEAHALGIVHRDLKPDNLFVTTGPDGRDLVKVLDFGISKSLISDNLTPMTQTMAVMGSPGYMSPEQMRSSKSVDPRTDVWSMGAVLYELVCGKVPYEASTLTELAFQIVEGPPPNPMVHRPDLPESLAQFILSCVERDRDRRCPSMAAFAQGLEPFLDPADRPYVRRVENASRRGPIPVLERPVEGAPSTYRSAAEPSPSVDPTIVAPVVTVPKEPSQKADGGSPNSREAELGTTAGLATPTHALPSQSQPLHRRKAMVWLGATIVTLGLAAGLGFHKVEQQAASATEAPHPPSASATSSPEGPSPSSTSPKAFPQESRPAASTVLEGTSGDASVPKAPASEPQRLPASSPYRSAPGASRPLSPPPKMAPTRTGSPSPSALPPSSSEPSGATSPRPPTGDFVRQRD